MSFSRRYLRPLAIVAGTIGLAVSGAVAHDATLPDGRSIAPAGYGFSVEGFADASALSPDREWLAVASPDTGIVDVLATHAKKAAAYGARFALPSASGVLWTSDGLFVSTGYDGIVKHYAFDATKSPKKLALTPDVDINVGPGLISGLAEDEATHRLFVARTANREVAIVDLTQKSGDLAAPAHLASNGEPYGLAFQNGTLFAALYDSDGVDAWKPSSTNAVKIVTGAHPTNLLARDGRVFVANADGNDVVAIDAASLEIAKRYDLSLSHPQPPGQTPAGMALSDDGATLYVAESGFNDVAVIDTASGAVRGRVPTGWYPTGVAYLAEKPPKLKDALWIVSAKGYGAQADPGGEWDGTYDGLVQHVALDPYQLRFWSSQVAVANGVSPKTPMARVSSRTPPIEHVVFIVRENKHFDEEFADLPGVNGDPNLLLYGKHFTPNAHALAARYTVFDNFDTDGEASIYGHAWTTQGWANDYHTRNARMAADDYDGDANVAVSIWPYPFHHAGVSQADMDFDWFRNLADLEKGPRVNVSGVFGPRGELIDELRSKNVSFRVYGEQMTMRPDGTIANGLPAHAAKDYPGDHIDFGVRDTERSKLFIDDLAKHGLAAYTYLTLPTDHTAGTKPGYLTPASFVSDNDVALGQIIAALSKRPDWKSTVVFVTCDDAQGTGDHLDSHRMPAFAAGGMVRRGFVDHTHYDQTSILRTVEGVFHLDPLSIYDARELPMADAFALQPDTTAYTALPGQIAIERNPGAIDVNNEASFVIDGPETRVIPDQEWLSIRGARSLAFHTDYLRRLDQQVAASFDGGDL